MSRIGFWLRLVAVLLDLILFLLAYAGTEMILLLIAPGYTTQRASSIAAAMIWLALTCSEVLAAASPGKLALGLRIARADGTVGDFWTLFLRWSSKHLWAICQLLFAVTSAPVFYMLGGFSGLVMTVGCLYASGDFKQAWHDQWARTAVFRKSNVQRSTMPAGASTIG